jgi:hypothetical protein
MAANACIYLDQVARLYEKWMARLADKHLCVTAAMQAWLKLHFGTCHVVRPWS